MNCRRSTKHLGTRPSPTGTQPKRVGGFVTTLCEFKFWEGASLLQVFFLGSLTLFVGLGCCFASALWTNTGIGTFGALELVLAALYSKFAPERFPH